VLSGDNLTKVRSDEVAAARARERFVEALAIARAHGFDDLVGIIELRLGDVGAGEPGS
jgi:hypothetical protein